MQQLNANVLGHAVAIVSKAIEQAEEGSVQHAKFLLELAGLHPPAVQPEDPAPSPAMEEFLRRLEESPSA